MTFLKNNLKMLTYLLLKVKGHRRGAKEVIHQVPSEMRAGVQFLVSPVTAAQSRYKILQYLKHTGKSQVRRKATCKDGFHISLLTAHV